MARKFIYSTLTSRQLYQNWEAGTDGGLPRRAHCVTIEGGSNVATKQLITPLGIRTEISDNDWEELQKNPTFMTHQKNGFVVMREEQVDPEVAAANMKLRDDSAPHTPETLSALNVQAKPMDGKVKKAG